MKDPIKCLECGYVGRSFEFERVSKDNFIDLTGQWSNADRVYFCPKCKGVANGEVDVPPLMIVHVENGKEGA